MKFSELEISQLIKAWAAISLAFTIAGLVGESFILGLGGISFNLFLQRFLISAFTVGVAFLLHELAHKLVAQQYGCWAEFRSFDMGLLLAIIMSFSGLVFAAPGAVVIMGSVTIQENGKIAAAGPLTNLALAVVFMLIGNMFALSGLWKVVLTQGVFINAWLALFNLLPLWHLDGKKIFQWNVGAWALMLTSAYLLL